MKKNIIGFALVAIAFIIGVFYFFTADENRISHQADREFAIKNTSNIDKIFLANKEGTQVTLTKNGDHWLVNNKYIAREDRIQSLLKTVSKVQVKSKVPKKKLESVIKNIATNHIKAEFFSNNNLQKSYFIGSATQKGDGTYMLMINPETLENSEQPFVTYIQGFQGYLTPRYEPLVKDWRDLKIFHFPKNRIKSVELTYPGNPANSFKIEIEDKKYVVKQDETNIHASSENIRKYLLSFKSIAAEQLVPNEGIGKNVFDNLKLNQPYFKLSVTDLSGKTNTVIGHQRMAKIGEVNAIGQPLQFDPDKLYGICFNGEELAILQYFVFGPLLKTASDFE